MRVALQGWNEQRLIAGNTRKPCLSRLVGNEVWAPTRLRPSCGRYGSGAPGRKSADDNTVTPAFPSPSKGVTGPFILGPFSQVNFLPVSVALAPKQASMRKLGVILSSSERRIEVLPKRSH